METQATNTARPTVAIIGSPADPQLAHDFPDRMAPLTGWLYFGEDGALIPTLSHPPAPNSHSTQMANVLLTCSEDALILPVNCQEFRSPFISSTAWVAAINYLIDKKVDPAAPTHLKNLRIINLSFGACSPNRLAYGNRQEQLVLRRALDNGILVVTAAGNESSCAPHFPSVFPETLCVSAATIVEGTPQLEKYSNYGPRIDLSAPGTFQHQEGTSIAAARVSAAAAQLFCLNMQASPSRIATTLLMTAAGNNTPGRNDQFGYGILNQEAAILSLKDPASQSIKPLWPNLDPLKAPATHSMAKTRRNRYRLPCRLSFSKSEGAKDPFSP